MQAYFAFSLLCCLIATYLPEQLCSKEREVFEIEHMEPVLSAECEPLTTVADCVNIISGHFFQIEKDLQGNTIEPLSIIRYYDSGNNNESSFGYGYGSQFPLWASDRQKGSRHYYAMISEREGFLLPYSGRSYSNSCGIDPRVLKKGYTNQSRAAVSGRANFINWKAEFSKPDGSPSGKWVVQLGDGTQRIYDKSIKISNEHLWRMNFPTKEAFLLTEEIKPNGNSLQFSYKEINEKIRLTEVKALNRTRDQVLNSLKFTYASGKCSVTNANGDKIDYFYEEKPCLTQYLYHPEEGVRKVLQTVDSSQNGISNYATKKEKGNRKVSKIVKPDGRFIEVEYLEAKNYKEEDRVIKILEPQGEKKDPVVTYSFVYEKDRTKVTDALGNIKTYQFDENYRLSAILYFDKKKHSIRKDRFDWSKNEDEKGWLRAKTIGVGDEFYYMKTYRYDTTNGTVTRSTLYGNLSGEKAGTFTLKNQMEMDKYITEYTYNNRNLVKNKITPEETITYKYLPETSLCTKILQEYDGKIQKRIFTAYDTNGQIASIIEDDGSDSEETNMADVQVRKIKRTEALTDAAHPAFGKPTIIEESYWDKQTNQEHPLKRIEITYDRRGSEEKRRVFNSKDEFCYETTTKYNEKLLLEEETNPLEQLTRYKYDDNHNKVEEELVGSGKTTTFAYDLRNRLIIKKEKHGKTEFKTKYAYNSLNQLETEIDPYGHTTTYKYDELGNQTECIKPLIQTADGKKINPTIKRTYNCLNELISETDENNYTTEYRYNAYGSPTKITYPDGSSEQFIYYLNGKLKKKQFADGTSIHYTYDGGGHLIKQETKDQDESVLIEEAFTYKGSLIQSYTDPMGVITSYEYDGAGRKIAEKIGDLKTIRYAYDDFGRLVKKEHEGRQQLFDYDWLDRITSKILQDSSGNQFKKETFEYDIQGNQTKKTNWLSNEKLATYLTNYNEDGTLNWKENPLNQRSSWEYDHHHENEQGQKVQMRKLLDPLMRLSKERDDIFHRLDSREHYTVNKKLSSEHYLYDPAGNLAKQTSQVMNDGALLREYSLLRKFDYRGHVTKETELPEKITTAYHYDGMGRLTKKIKADGVVLEYTYDPLGRVKTLASSDQTIHYAYTYDLHDNLIKIEDRVHNLTQNRSFDLLNRLEKEEISPGVVIQYTYDPFDRPLTMTLPDKSTVVYHYNPYRLEKIERFNSSQELLYQIECPSYDWQGHLLQSTSPAGTIAYSYDLLGRPVSIQSPLWESHLELFDAAGNLTKMSQKDPGGTSKEQFTYDRFNHLTSESTSKFAYDSLGNCLKKNNLPQKINPLNQVTESNGSIYTYDLNGNLKSQSNPSVNYTYDALNRLIAIEKEGKKTTFRYDALNRCLEITDSETTRKLLYQGTQEIGSLINEQTDQFRLLHPEQDLTFAIELKDTHFFPIQDTRGNICALQTTDGSLAQWIRYSAFGEKTINGDKSLSNPWLFANRREIESLSLFTHRLYNPRLMRWQTADPLGFEDGLNLYTYVRNNPYSYKDPDGRFVMFLVPVVTGVFGASGIVISVATAEAISGSIIGFALGWGAYETVKWADHKLNQVETDKLEEAQEERKRKSRGVYAPDRPLPQDDKHKRPIPDQNAEGAHTQLGTKSGRFEKYPQAREFDKNGNPVRDVDFTDHGYPLNHTNPHQHLWIENDTGGTPKRDDATPVSEWIY